MIYKTVENGVVSYIDEEGKTVARMSKPDRFSEEELSITEHGVHLELLAYNNRLLNKKTGEVYE